jgi:hypothetical protein
MDLPGFFTNWTNLVCITFYLTVLILAKSLPFVPTQSEVPTFIPQYASWYPYQVALKIPATLEFGPGLQVSVTVVSGSTSALLVSGNLTTSTFSSEFQISAPNEAFPLFSSPSGTDSPREIKIDFSPGLSPADHLLFSVALNSTTTALIMSRVYAGFAAAVGVQLLLFCLRPSCQFGLDTVQIATAVLLLLRLALSLSLACRYHLEWFSLNTCLA